MITCHKITRQYMDKYGIYNVCGGSFVSVKLSKSVLNTLQQIKMELMINVLIVVKGTLFVIIIKKMNMMMMKMMKMMKI